MKLDYNIQLLIFLTISSIFTIIKYIFYLFLHIKVISKIKF